MLRNNPVDVVVSDMRMPEMRGEQLLINRINITPNALRITLTGLSEGSL